MWTFEYVRCTFYVLKFAWNSDDPIGLDFAAFFNVILYFEEDIHWANTMTHSLSLYSVFSSATCWNYLKSRIVMFIFSTYFFLFCEKNGTNFLLISVDILFFYNFPLIICFLNCLRHHFTIISMCRVWIYVVWRYIVVNTMCYVRCTLCV